ncbi:MAG: hypothetical protein K0S68_1092, partial [Candidatus Saccharibacteria bacterium]|nr:hypothetical protein [Candidatus Saccharibacteria bacterium]
MLNRRQKKRLKRTMRRASSLPRTAVNAAAWSPTLTIVTATTATVAYLATKTELGRRIAMRALDAMPTQVQDMGRKVTHGFTGPADEAETDHSQDGHEARRSPMA